MKPTLFCCLLVCSLGLANVRGQEANKPEEKKPMDTNQKEVAVLKTSDGEMVVEFWPDVAPEDGREFQETGARRLLRRHRVSSHHQGLHDPGRRSEHEGSSRTKPAMAPAARATASRRNSTIVRIVRGVLSMARSADPNSAGSQFFICLGTASSLDQQYTAFGKLIKGLDVLDKIGDTPVSRSASGEMSKPQTRVALESVKIVPADSVK